jgi:hypothetical protein
MHRRRNKRVPQQIQDFPDILAPHKSTEIPRFTLKDPLEKENQRIHRLVLRALGNMTERSRNGTPFMESAKSLAHFR